MKYQQSYEHTLYCYTKKTEYRYVYHLTNNQLAVNVICTLIWQKPAVNIRYLNSKSRYVTLYIDKGLQV